MATRRRRTPPPWMYTSTQTMQSNQDLAPFATLTGLPIKATGTCSAASTPQDGETAAISGAAVGAIITLLLLCALPFVASKKGFGARLAGMMPGTGETRLPWRPPLFMAFACLVYAQSVFYWGNVQAANATGGNYWGASSSTGLQGLASFIGFAYSLSALAYARAAKAAGVGPKPSLLLFASLSLYMLQQATVAWTTTTSLNLVPRTYCNDVDTADADAVTRCTTKQDNEMKTCQEHMRTVVQAGGGFSALFAYIAWLAATLAVVTRLGIKNASAAVDASGIKRARAGMAPSRALSNAMLALKLMGMLCGIVALASDQLQYGDNSSRLDKLCFGSVCSSENMPGELTFALAFTVLAFLACLVASVAHAVALQRKAVIRHKLMGYGTIAATVCFCAAFSAVAKYLSDFDSQMQRVTQFGDGFIFNVIGFLLMLAHSVFSVCVITNDGAAGGAVAPGGGGAQQQQQQQLSLPSPFVTYAFAWSAFVLDVAASNTFYGETQFAKEDCKWTRILKTHACDTDKLACDEKAQTAAQHQTCDKASQACTQSALDNDPNCEFNASTYPLSAYKAGHLIPGVILLLAAVVLLLQLLSDRCACLSGRIRTTSQRDGGGARNFVWYARHGAIFVAVWARACQCLALGDMVDDDVLDKLDTTEGMFGWVCALCLFGMFVACGASAYCTAVAFTPCASGDQAKAKKALFAPWNLLNCAIGCLLFAVCVLSGFMADVIQKGKSGRKSPNPEAANVIAGLATLWGFFFAMAAALVPDVDVPAIAFPKLPACPAAPADGSGGGGGGSGSGNAATAAGGVPQPAVNPASAGGAGAGSFCANCGAKQPPGAKFCASCGHPQQG